MSEQDELLTVEDDRNHDIEMGEALERLRKNPDFKKVILEGYLEGKVLASVSLLAVPAIKQQGQRQDVMEDLIAASNLQYFFMMVDNAFEGAKDPILSEEEEAELAAARENDGVH